MICPHCLNEITQSMIAVEIGKHTSEKKKKSSAENGKKGGRPKTKGKIDTKQKTC